MCKQCFIQVDNKCPFCRKEDFHPLKMVNIDRVLEQSGQNAIGQNNNPGDVQVCGVMNIGGVSIVWNFGSVNQLLRGMHLT